MSLSEKLIAAAKNGNTREVRKLLGRGALFTKDKFGNTALHEAAWNGNNDIVKILLNGFCFVDSINNTGFTPLHLASQNGHAKVVKTLLKWKAAPTLLNQHGETALHLVAKYDHASVVASFTGHKVSLDIRGKDGNTALHIAAKLGNIETTKAMLSGGAHPALPNERGMRPLDYAEAGDYRALAKLLHSAMHKIKPKQRSSNASLKASPKSSSFTPSPMSCSPYSMSQPEESAYGFSLSQPMVDLPAVRPKMQRTMSASSKVPYKTSKDVWASVNKQKNKKNSSSQRERGNMHSGSLSPSPHKYFSSQDDLDSGVCAGPKDRTFRSLSPGDPSELVTIDQLLTEIETEYNGPDYRYIPPSREDPYAKYTESPTTRHPLSISSNNPKSPQPAKSFLKSTRNGATSKENYDILEGTCTEEEYDYLHPPNSNSNSNNSPLHASNQVRVCIEHTQKQDGPVRTQRLPTPPDTPPKKDRFKNHTYETLLPKEDTDTYVYMAPLSDYPELLQQECAAIRAMTSPSPQHTDSQSLLSESGSELSVGGGNKGGKKAAIRDSPIEADRKHEPNLIMEPVKGILSHSSSGEIEKSQLEDYLQNELETIRQAFQIRLNQLEKRYQKQLELEKQRNAVSPQTKEPTQRLDVLRQRRNSWHSYIAAEQEFDKYEDTEKRSDSVLDGESDLSEVDSDVVKPNEDTCPDLYEHDPTLVNELPESLRHTDANQSVASTSDQQEDKQSDKDLADYDYEDMSGGVGSQELVQQKVKEYRERMLKHFREKSEAKIAAIEKEYQSQISEVQKKCQDNASEKFVQLQTRIKDLEGRLEVQTLV